MPSSAAQQFPIVRLRADAVKDPRLTELPGRTRSLQSRNSLAASAADCQPGRVPGPDRSGEVDRASAPVLIDVLAYQHRGI